ncbi:hypothetical protein BDW69DRAFT_185735 [Aspergillus filifer]
MSTQYSFPSPTSSSTFSSSSSNIASNNMDGSGYQSCVPGYVLPHAQYYYQYQECPQHSFPVYYNNNNNCGYYNNYGYYTPSPHYTAENNTYNYSQSCNYNYNGNGYAYTSAPATTNNNRIDDSNAQQFCPATARVMVGNLPPGIDIVTIRAGFNDIGWNFVHLHSGGKHPVAFVQFLKDEHAQQALARHKRLFLNGRCVRIELARDGQVQLEKQSMSFLLYTS